MKSLFFPIIDPLSPLLGPKTSSSSSSLSKLIEDCHGAGEFVDSAVSSVDISECNYLLKYLKEHYRPFNVITLFDNLHGKLKKNNILKYLNKLISQNLVIEKKNGKQSFFILIQEDVPDHILTETKEQYNQASNLFKELTDVKQKLLIKLKNFEQKLTKDDVNAKKMQLESWITIEKAKRDQKKEEHTHHDQEKLSSYKERLSMFLYLGRQLNNMSKNLSEVLDMNIAIVEDQECELRTSYADRVKMIQNAIIVNK